MGIYDQLSQLQERPSAAVAPTPSNQAPEPNDRSTERKRRTVRAHGSVDRLIGSSEPSSILAELTGETAEPGRATERYSFEIFTDQKSRMYEVQHRYLTRTGHKLAASRIIRDALEEYLDKLDAVRKGDS